MPDFTGWSIWINISLFTASAGVVWIAGTRMVHLVDRLAERTGMGQGFAGMMLLGGIVSLTEISTVSTAAISGSPTLAINNLLGSVSINIALLALIDPLFGREALTSFVAKPAMLYQAALGMILLAVVSMAITTGDYPIFGVGAWSTALFLLCLAAMWRSSRYERHQVWIPADEDEETSETASEEADGSGKEGLGRLILKLTAVAAVIFVAGFSLSMTGDAIASQTGLGQNLVGFVLVGLSTSLPEASSIIAAVRLKRYEMAVGDVLGSNVYNLLLIFLTDLVYPGDPVLNHAGRFEVVASLLAIVMSGILLLGLLERKDRTIFRMGYDSAAILLSFLGGMILLSALGGGVQ